MTRVPMTQAVSADYADAMLVARRAKNQAFLLLLLTLLIQMGIFLTVKYVPSVKVKAEVASPLATATTTAPATTTASVTILEHRDAAVAGSRLASPTVEWIIGGTVFLGIVLAVVLPVLLLLIIAIMLVGRLVGVAHVTSAFCLSLVFFALLFPWQTLLNTQASTFPIAQAGTMTSGDDVPRVRFPGALYTFSELQRDYDFHNDPVFPVAILGWGRFILLPLVTLILLLIVNGRSSRGLRFALGETEVPVEVVATNP